MNDNNETSQTNDTVESPKILQAPAPNQEIQNDLRSFFRLLETRSTAPTDTPRSIYQQIRLVVAGGVASLYIYDVSNNKWRAASLAT